MASSKSSSCFSAFWRYSSFFEWGNFWNNFSNSCFVFSDNLSSGYGISWPDWILSKLSRISLRSFSACFCLISWDNFSVFFSWSCFSNSFFSLPLACCALSSKSLISLSNSSCHCFACSFCFCFSSISLLNFSAASLIVLSICSWISFLASSGNSLNGANFFSKPSISFCNPSCPWLSPRAFALSNFFLFSSNSFCFSLIFFIICLCSSVCKSISTNFLTSGQI